MSMNKKAKKRIPIVRERIAKLQKLLAATKLQCDDPQELRDLEQQIEKAKEELAELLKE
jgi:predicted  nucleic acid-binding Zn-ribbon protein